METSLFRLTRPLFDTKGCRQPRGAVLPFANLDDPKSEAPRAPSSALLVGSEAEKAFAEKIGVAEQAVEEDKKAKPLTSVEPEPAIDLSNVGGKALSELAKPKAAKK